MIKGHTKIELFNAETGKIEKTYEKDNLVGGTTSTGMRQPARRKSKPQISAEPA